MISYKSFAKAILICLLMLPIQNCKAEEKTAPTLYPLIIHAKSGAQMFQVEFVNTPETMAKGLMFRESMPKDHGMLFLFPEEQEVSFWMRNTLIPLDMLFIRADGTIATIHANAKPHDETGIPSNAVVLAVLEINGGEALQRGIESGNMVETPLLQGSKK